MQLGSVLLWPCALTLYVPDDDDTKAGPDAVLEHAGRGKATAPPPKQKPSPSEQALVDRLKHLYHGAA